eukprot:13550483-Ditylum_brightwellii.AAC.1
MQKPSLKFRGNPTMHNTKDCRTYTVTSRKCPSSDHRTVNDLQAPNLKLSKKLKKNKNKRHEYKSTLLSRGRIKR